MQNLRTRQLILIIIVIIIVAPWLLTFTVFADRFNYSSTGQIGDTIGGITAPFINGLAAILVFITFREQVKANKLLKDESESQNIMEQIKSLEKNNIQIEHVVASIIDLADLFTAENQHRSLAVQLDRALYFLSEFHLAESLLEDYQGDKIYMYKKLNYMYKIRYAMHLETLRVTLQARIGLQQNRHELACAEILLSIQGLNEYFENVNRYTIINRQ